jgi:hypothetical protein
MVKKLTSVLLMFLLVLSLSACSVVSIFFIDEEPPVINTSRMIDLSNRAIDINYIESVDLSANKIGITASDNRDGNVTRNIQYDYLGLENRRTGFYLYVRYYVTDRAGNYTSVDVPFVVYDRITINSSNFNDYFTFRKEYVPIQAYIPGSVSNLSYIIRTSVVSKFDIRLSSSSLRYSSETTLSWVRIVNETRSRWNGRTYQTTSDTIRTPLSQVVRANGAIGNGQYLRNMISSTLSTSEVRLNDTDYRTVNQSFPCCYFATHQVVRDNNVTKSTKYQITGSAEAILFITDRP